MALSEKDKANWEKTLKELKLMEEGDEVEAQVVADYYEKVLIFRNQVKGNLLFTRDRFVFCSTFGVNNVSVPYKEIKTISNCKAGLMPGFEITIYDNKKNKDISYIFGMMQRDQWVELIEEKRR
ncbi:MAG: hypothetical protein J6J42_10105 [Lachnospiraceae bacterium]|nr:hypothetical protein [Lachnospiraceae bacterium]MBP3610675.1 hypothetical protein [Lachnospiraceae bacterium]